MVLGYKLLNGGYMKLKDLPPPPPIFNKKELIAEINTKLVNGIKLIDIKNPRRTWISYEYHLDIIYTINNKQKTLLPNNYYDKNNYPLKFFDQLLNRLLKIKQQEDK
ncbi:hypothetical protein Kolga_gp38 [Pelagibacter phage Kolga EXVC016S]|nr:hypothetical protein Kolga_gp38 [Pelagibacter phage Kolga EXVC016S]